MILAVALLRCCLTRTPRWILCLLWLLVAVRFLLPFQLQSPVSLQPNATVIAEVFENESPSLQQPNVSPGEALPPALLPETPAPPQAISETELLAWGWMGIATAVLLYAMCTYFILRFQLRKAVLREPGVREGSMVPGAFVLGYFRPVVYLPQDMDDRERVFVLAHERAHIARADHWWKLLGYLCCCIHWFNPLAWLGFMLASRDIEYACDEKVAKHMDLEQRKAYTLALLHYGRGTNRLTAYPVSFVGGGLKQRVRKVLALKKAAPWRYALSLLAVGVTALCFLTSPAIAAEMTEPPQFQIEIPEATVPEETDPTQWTEPEETQPAETEPTKPSKPAATKPTKPKPSDPEPTEPVKPVIQAKPTVSGVIPTAVQNGASAPGADTPTHSHAYTMRVQAPTCLEIGYTVNTCVCGHVYYNGYRSATGHNWSLVERKQVSALEDGTDLYQCGKCAQQRQEVTGLAGYKSFDLPGVDKELTDYAAKLGFQTEAGRPDKEAEIYGHYWSIEDLYSFGGRAQLVQTGKEFIRRAKDEYQSGGNAAGACTIWVELVMEQGVTLRVYCAR